MKTIKNIIMAIALIGLLTATGCIGPLYTREGQHTTGHGWGLFGSDAATAAKTDRLALAKLQSSPTQTLVTNGVPQGYRGLVANLSSHQRYNFTITGPETKSYLLGPGQRVVDYLLPGTYTCRITHGGSEVGHWTFHSRVQQSQFLGESCHWYVYAER